jgi:hypothetical protein
MIFGSTPVQKVSKNPSTAIAYYVLFFTVSFFKSIQIYSRQPIHWTMFALMIDAITIFLHLSLLCIDPGYLVKQKNVEFLKLLEHYDCTCLCPECETIRTGRSRHCIICHKCVDRYDHHCPWINNCIGLRNYKIFLVFIVF